MSNSTLRSGQKKNKRILGTPNTQPAEYVSSRQPKSSPSTVSKQEQPITQQSDSVESDDKKALRAAHELANTDKAPQSDDLKFENQKQLDRSDNNFGYNALGGTRTDRHIPIQLPFDGPVQSPPTSSFLSNFNPRSGGTSRIFATPENIDSHMVRSQSTSPSAKSVLTKRISVLFFYWILASGASGAFWSAFCDLSDPSPHFFLNNSAKQLNFALGAGIGGAVSLIFLGLIFYTRKILGFYKTDFLSPKQGYQSVEEEDANHPDIEIESENNENKQQSSQSSACCDNRCCRITWDSFLTFLEVVSATQLVGTAIPSIAVMLMQINLKNSGHWNFDGVRIFIGFESAILLFCIVAFCVSKTLRKVCTGDYNLFCCVKNKGESGNSFQPPVDYKIKQVVAPLPFDEQYQQDDALLAISNAENGDDDDVAEVKRQFTDTVSKVNLSIANLSSR